MLIVFAHSLFCIRGWHEGEHIDSLLLYALRFWQSQTYLSMRNRMASQMSSKLEGNASSFPRSKCILQLVLLSTQALP